MLGVVQSQMCCVLTFQAKTSRGAKASALLSLLPKRGPEAFRVFIEALIITDQDILANLLDPNHALASHNEPQHQKIPTSTEVSNDPETQIGSGGATKKEASTPENKKEVSTRENKKEVSTPENKKEVSTRENKKEVSTHERTEETERWPAATPEKPKTRSYFENGTVIVCII